MNSPGKWTTTAEGIQYVRELEVLEVIYSDLDSDEVSKDTMHMSHAEEGHSKCPNIIF